MKARFAACFFLGVLVMLPFLLGANEKGCTLPTCTDGQVQCSGSEVQTCQNSAWVNTTDCSASGDTCQNGQCFALAVCTNGTVGTGMCCLSVGDFPNTCPTTPCVCPAGQICNCPVQLVGACGCSSENSHEVKVCNCPPNMCFDGTKCVVPAVCIDGQTQCSGNEIQTCQNGAWVNTTNCSASGNICENGDCIQCLTAADCTGATASDRVPFMPWWRRQLPALDVSSWNMPDIVLRVQSALLSAGRDLGFCPVQLYSGL